MVELGCSSALELLPPYPEVDVHSQPSLLSEIVVLSNPVVLDCKCALETNPQLAHKTQIWRCWQDSPVFPAFACYWLLLGQWWTLGMVHWGVLVLKPHLNNIFWLVAWGVSCY